jgi:hypothetical protein
MAVCGVALALAACGGNGDSGSPPAPAAGDDSFTFFDIGRTTRYSEAVRKALSAKLGNDAIEQRSIINLETHYKGFLKTHLPELDELNRKLNDPPGERVDHAVVKLMYRYARKKNAPFDYIEIVFGAGSLRPVFIRTKFKVDEAGILETLREKHGPPQEIPWAIEGGRSLAWRKDKDLLVASLVPNQFGRPEYQICIYFTENLAGMISAEQGRDAQKARQRSRTAQDVF